MGLIHRVENKIVKIKKSKSSNEDKIRLIEKLRNINVESHCPGCKKRIMVTKRVVLQIITHEINKLKNV